LRRRGARIVGIHQHHGRRAHLRRGIVVGAQVSLLRRRPVGRVRMEFRRAMEGSPRMHFRGEVGGHELTRRRLKVMQRAFRVHAMIGMLVWVQRCVALRAIQHRMMQGRNPRQVASIRRGRRGHFVDQGMQPISSFKDRLHHLNHHRVIFQIDDGADALHMVS
jgi:hypothetical protein